jgi:hypothetical protein
MIGHINSTCILFGSMQSHLHWSGHCLFIYFPQPPQLLLLFPIAQSAAATKNVISTTLCIWVLTMPKIFSPPCSSRRMKWLVEFSPTHETNYNRNQSEIASKWWDKKKKKRVRYLERKVAEQAEKISKLQEELSCL